MIFKASNDGLYYNNMINTKGVYMLNNMEENQNHYNQQQYERAKMAGELYQTVGHPYIQKYKNIIKMNGINNCPVMIDDIDIYEKIFCPNIYTLKGNTVCTKPKSVVNDYIGITQELNNTHQKIELCDDIMYIQGQISLVTISKTIKSITIQDTTERKIPILNK